MDLIAGGLGAGALAALARRRNLAEPVADAVVHAGDVGAVAALLDNRTAKLTEPILDKIAARAEHRSELHLPLCVRENLPVRVVRRVASFVSAALVETLTQKNRLSPAVAEEIRANVRKRIEAGTLAGDAPTVKPADERAREMSRAGTLDEDAVRTALDAGDSAFVRHALCLLSALKLPVVQSLLNTGGVKGVAALAWKAGLSMDFAEQLQRRLGRIRPRDVLRPTASGDYPLTEADMNWYLDFYV